MNQSETKTCQSCKSSFQIDAEDFDFYQKIDVPPPTFCPTCRFMRRVSFRNERNFYKRKCNLCNTDIISMYSHDVPFPVYCRDCWYSDKWDPQDYSADYSSDQNFFVQYKDLMNKVPRPALIATNNVNSNYVNYSINLKDCYFLVGSSDNENCAHAYRTFNTKDSVDCFGAVDCEHVYDGVQVSKCANVFFSRDTENSMDSFFILNCRNVSNCIGSTNIQNKKYVILNNEYSKEEYEKRKKDYLLDTWDGIQKLKKEAELLSLNFPRRFAHIVLSKDSTGNDLIETKNCKHCFVMRESENLKYGAFGGNIKESYDVNFADNSELVYDSTNIEQNYMEKFSITSWFSKYITYCELCLSCSNCFGCISLKKKEYCILNKQYTKEEYEKLSKIIMNDMQSKPYADALGRKYSYGEFFPSEISPFAYNESIAREYFPMSRDDAKKGGHTWREENKMEYAVTMSYDKIPNKINEVTDNICKEIIGCEHDKKCNDGCTGAFRITPQELQFHRAMALPIPHLCPNCRHQSRLKQRNPLKLWHRSCQCGGNASTNDELTIDSTTTINKIQQNTYKNTTTHAHGDGPCPNEFQTSYSPERKEIIYCEECYQREIA